MMMGSTDASTTELSLLSFPENESNLDERSDAISKVATISCAVPTVYLPGIPVGSVCEVESNVSNGDRCLSRVYLKIERLP